MNVQNGVAAVHVVRTADDAVEVFSSADEAWQYARHKRGASVLERKVHHSLSEAQMVYERRVHIVDGVVRRDSTVEEPFFTVGADTWISEADVESFEAKDQRWTIVGLGTERQAIDELVEVEITRLTSAALWPLRHRAPA